MTTPGEWILLAGVEPCPFCGNNVEISFSKGDRRMRCDRCGCLGPKGQPADEPRDVFDRWKRRAY